MTLFNQLDQWYEGRLSPSVKWSREAARRVMSLVVRCDTCNGKGYLFDILGRLEKTKCPAGCVDGWQPSDALLAAVFRGLGFDTAWTTAKRWPVTDTAPTRDAAGAVVRLIGEGGTP